jgi:hypothetical protein
MEVFFVFFVFFVVVLVVAVACASNFGTLSMAAVLISDNTEVDSRLDTRVGSPGVGFKNVL